LGAWKNQSGPGSEKKRRGQKRFRGPGRRRRGQEVTGAKGSVDPLKVSKASKSEQKKGLLEKSAFKLFGGAKQWIPESRAKLQREKLRGSNVW